MDKKTQGEKMIKLIVYQIYTTSRIINVNMAYDKPIKTMKDYSELLLHIQREEVNSGRHCQVENINIRNIIALNFD